MQADWKEGFKKKQVGVSDMTLLTTITNDGVNENLSKRWKNAEIYTYIGGVLISVNPFQGVFQLESALFSAFHSRRIPTLAEPYLTNTSLSRSGYLYR